MSEAYLAITANNDAAVFPDTKPIDSSGPLATDGSELLKEVMDDVWAEKQAALDFYNQTPNGSPDDPGKDGTGKPFSQPLAQMYYNYQTPGQIIALMWEETLLPVNVGGFLGLDIRFFFLQGQGIDLFATSDFEALNQLCYVGNAANPTAEAFYRADDAAGTIRNVVGQFLIMPDMRGQFLRGYDPGALVDPDGASRIPGSSQLDAFQNITGSFEQLELDGGTNVIQLESGAFSPGGPTARIPPPPILFAGISTTGPANNTPEITDFDASGSPGARTSTESRAVNLAVRWGIYF